MTYRFLRQNAHADCWRPLHASGFPIAQLNVGMPLNAAVEPPVLVRISAWSDEPTDYMEQPFPVVTDRMRDALDRAGVDNVEYIRAQVQRERSTVVESGYWLFNVVGKVSCVDPVASGLHDAEGSGLRQLARIVLDPARTYGLGLFRLAEDPRMIVVGPHVQVALQASHLRGVLLQEPSEYNRGRAVSQR
jgi:hypothetical protein